MLIIFLGLIFISSLSPSSLALLPLLLLRSFNAFTWFSSAFQSVIDIEMICRNCPIAAKSCLAQHHHHHTSTSTSTATKPICLPKLPLLLLLFLLDEACWIRRCKAGCCCCCCYKIKLQTQYLAIAIEASASVFLSLFFSKLPVGLTDCWLTDEYEKRLFSKRG